MLLNLAALAMMGIAAAIAGLLLRRYLPSAGAAFRPECARCGTPGAALTSFTCPGCNQDVREAGLRPPRGRARLTPFRGGVAFTTLFLVAALALSNVLLASMPDVEKVTKHTAMRVTSPDIYAVDLFLAVSGKRGDDLRGQLIGHLYGGREIALEIARPGTRWRLLDADERELGAGEGLDREMIDRWLSAAGLDLQSDVIRSDAAYIAGQANPLLGVKIAMPPAPPIPDASYSSTTGGISSGRPDERNLPVLVIIWSALWAAGLWLMLASTATRRRSPLQEAGSLAGAEGVPS
jgi:hypothetical protein